MKLTQNWKILFATVGVVLILLLLWYLRAIIGYALIAVVVAFIGDPICQFLKRFRFKRFVLPSWFRALFTLAVLCALLVGLIRLFSPLVKEEVAIISQINPHLMGQRIEEQLGFLSNDYVFLTEDGKEVELTEYLISKAQSIFSLSWAQNLFGNIVAFVSNFIIGLFAVLFMAFFFLKDGFLFARIVFTLTPSKHMDKMKNIMEHSHKLLGRFFIGICLQSFIMAFIIGLSLHLLGVQNAILIGLFAGLVNVIPYVGPLLGAGFGILIALTTSLHLDFDAALLPLLLKIVTVFVVAQQIDGFVIQPLVLGGSVKAHPLEIFIVVLAAGTLGGILGMVVAIPAYTILRIVAREFLSQFKVVDSLTRDITSE